MNFAPYLMVAGVGVSLLVIGLSIRMVTPKGTSVPIWAATGLIEFLLDLPLGVESMHSLGYRIA